MPRSLEERFWAKVSKGEGDDCWEWTAYRNKGGYGKIARGGSKNERIRAHRLSWILHNGPIPTGAVVCHRCDNPGCVNPYHLFLGTQKDNLQDAQRKGRMARGERNHHAKLSRNQVLEIRAQYASGNTSTRALATKYGVSQTSISTIVRREVWKHI